MCDEVKLLCYDENRDGIQITFNQFGKAYQLIVDSFYVRSCIKLIHVIIPDTMKNRLELLKNGIGFYADHPLDENGKPASLGIMIDVRDILYISDNDNGKPLPTRKVTLEDDALADTVAVEASIIKEHVDPQAYEGMTDAELLDTIQSWEADDACCRIAEGSY